MADESLTLLLNEIRGKTFRMLDGVTEEQARFSPPGLVNTILWHAGHALIVNEHLGAGPATGKPLNYPAGWFEKFSWKSQPATVTEWPTLGEVVEKLKDQQQRIAAALAEMSDEQLSHVIDPARNRTLRYSILHGLHDEANHQGEIWLLKKLFNKKVA